MSDNKDFVNMLGESLDEAKTDINILYDIYKSEYVTEDLLNILASYLNYDIDNTTSSQFDRTHIKHIVQAYQTKGTVPSINELITNLGYNVKVVPLWTPDFPIYENKVIVG
jgi:phage tail-like protein